MPPSPLLFQIFSRVGKVLKIVTFTKNNSFQALIQYPDVVTAQAAKLVRGRGPLDIREPRGLAGRAAGRLGVAQFSHVGTGRY